MLVSNTTLEVKVDGNYIPEQFETNLGSPQGDALSGTLFDIYLEDALIDARESIEIHVDHTYRTPSHLPDEAIYADDTDFLTTQKEQQLNIASKIPTSLSSHNLIVNPDKTEYTELKRGGTSP